jgi:predicted nucleic acid-binding protein
VIPYGDASALVKLYIEEAGTDETRQFLDGAPFVVTADLTKVEVVAAFCRRANRHVNDGGISHHDALAATEAFDAAWPSFVRVSITGAIVEQARQLVGKHGLRAYDAIHLACALFFQEK